MTIAISLLPVLVAPADADEIPIVDADEGVLANKTKRLTIANLKAGLVVVNDLRTAIGWTFNGPIDKQQTGTSELWVGSFYLTSGSVLKAASRAMMGATSPGDTATLNLRANTGGALLAAWTVTGLPANAPMVGGVDVPVVTTDWYDLYLVAGGALETADIKGLRLLVYPS